jgi:hypothetical protein
MQTITPAQALADEYQPVKNFTGNRWKDIGMADRFMIAWNQQGIHHSDLTAEYQFDADRKWKFDFAFPSCDVLAPPQPSEIGIEDLLPIGAM